MTGSLRLFVRNLGDADPHITTRNSAYLAIILGELMKRVTAPRGYTLNSG